MVIKWLAVLAFLMLSFSVSAAAVNVNKASVDEISATLVVLAQQKQQQFLSIVKR